MRNGRRHLPDSYLLCGLVGVEELVATINRQWTLLGPCLMRRCTSCYHHYHCIYPPQWPWRTLYGDVVGQRLERVRTDILSPSFFFFWLYFLACSCFHCPLLLGLDPDRRVIATRFPFTVCFLFLLDAASGMAMLPGRLGFI